MSIVGWVAEIWRYPVKSMGGERLDDAVIGPRGLFGDRGWATRDEEAGEVRGAKNLPGLLRCSARYLEPPTLEGVPPAEITLPDGRRLRSDQPDASTLLSEAIGRQVTLWPLQPAENVEHYRRVFREGADMDAEMRAVFGRLPEEPLPDFSVFPPEIFQYTSPVGTYFDAFPIHLLTTATLARMGELNGGARFDVRRFRPNLVVAPEDGAPGTPEVGWAGRELRVGEARLTLTVPCPRCVMTTLAQGDLPKDPSVLRTIVREAGQDLGVYATVAAAGHVQVGDAVELIAI